METNATSGTESNSESEPAASVTSGTSGAPTTRGSTSDPSSQTDATPDDQSTTGPGPNGETGSSTDAPEEGSTGSDVRHSCEGRSRVAFINFDGASISYGNESASENHAELEHVVGEWSAYTGGDREDVLERVRLLFATFDLCVTDTRPSAGPYDMVFVTDTPHKFPVYAHITDCNDWRGAGSVARFSPGPSGPGAPSYSTAQKANAIARVLGISFGLTVVDASNDVMHFPSFESSDDAAFTNACEPEPSSSSGNVCGSAHGCGFGSHNSYAMLLRALGAAPEAP